MRLIAAITDPDVVQNILEHLRLWPPPERPPKPPRAPPAAPASPAPMAPASAPEEESQVPSWWEDDEAFSQVPPGGDL